MSEDADVGNNGGFGGLYTGYSQWEIDKQLKKARQALIDRGEIIWRMDEKECWFQQGIDKEWMAMLKISA